MSPGIHVIAKTAREVSVHLGPQWYLERQEFSVEPKERLTVTGSRVVLGEAAVIASELRKGDLALVLQDAQGYRLVRLAKKPLKGFHDEAVVHLEDTVEALDHAVVVGDDEDGRVVLHGQLLEQGHDILAVLGIERGRRLVGQDRLRAVGERPGDGHPLAFAAGQRGGVVLKAVPRVEGAESSVARARASGSVRPMILQGDHDVLGAVRKGIRLWA